MKNVKSTGFCIISLCMAGSILLSACSQKAEMTDITDTADSNSASVNETVGGETGQVDEPQSSESTSRELTPDETSFFSDYLSRSGNWGFLLSTYKSPGEIDLNELFYSGAGISNYSLTEEEGEDFLNASGAEEIYTDVVHLTTAQIDDFLLEKTGLTYAQMQKGLGWVYSAQTDTWYHQAGDTNWRPFECVGGTADGDVYKLHVKATDSEPGYRAELYETVLRKNGDGYQFVSNLFMEEEGKIEEQSFALFLEPWGEVTFAAYTPEEDGEPTADVTFRVVQDGKLLMTLYGVAYDNIRENQYFLSVDAIAFPDFNSDGYTDLITIASYSHTAGADADDCFVEARVYSGNDWGRFVYERDMSEAVNSAVAELTVDSVLGFLGVDR